MLPLQAYCYEPAHNDGHVLVLWCMKSLYDIDEYIYF